MILDNVLFSYKDFSFGVSSQVKIKSLELPSIIRELFCIAIVFNLAFIALDNREFDKLKKFPSEILQSKSTYCPDKEESGLSKIRWERVFSFAN